MMFRATPSSQASPFFARRGRDRLMRLEGIANPTLARQHLLQNSLLLVDDDLHETAHALGGIEAFLVEALGLLEREDLTAAELSELASDTAVEERLDVLCDTLASLRRQMGHIATTLK